MELGTRDRTGTPGTPGRTGTLGRRAFGALAGTSALGLALGGSGVGGAAGTSAGTRGPVPTGPPPGRPAADGVRHRVDVDRHSLLVDGRRLVLSAGETHPFRLPSPSLWRDVLEKTRAYGGTAVVAVLDRHQLWAGPGHDDLTGVRDLGLFLRLAAGAGLYVVLRPVPRPGADAEAWLSRVHAVAARHLYTRGTGTVLLYRTGVTAPEETARLRERLRADGLDLPLVHDGSPLAWGEVRGAADPAAVRRGRLDRLGAGPVVHTVAAFFGGTSWGWLPGPPAPGPVYDPTAPLDEARRPTERMAPVHQFGHLLRHVPDLARLEEAPGGGAGDDRLRVRRLANPDTGARFHLLANDSAEEVTSTVPLDGRKVPVTLPAGDARLLASGLPLGAGMKLAYATVQPMAVLSAGRQDIAVFAGRAGETAHVVLDCPSEPWPSRLDEEAAWAYDQGRLHVTAPLAAGRPVRVRVRGADSRRPLLLVLADDAASLRLWPYETPSGALLVQGPELLREAVVDGATLRLTGDTVDECPLEVWAPRGVTGVTWNGRPVRTTAGRAGSLRALHPLPGVREPELPALDDWRRRAENPESAPDHDDARWTVADRRTSASSTPVPGEQPVLFAEEYGFWHGDVWYRGRLLGAAGLEWVSLAHRAGPRGLVMAWLDGEPLGVHHTEGAGITTARFALPGKLRERLLAAPGTPVLAVLVRRTRDPEEGPGGADGRTAGGLVSAAFGGVSPEVRWRVRGQSAPDPVRGPLNTGGLYGEREGWHLPGHDDGGWEPVAAPRAEPRQGVAWYRTVFRLDVPPEVDASPALVLDGVSGSRVQVFLNGWNLGEYGEDGRGLVLPGGVLRTRAAANTLALAVLSDGSAAAAPGSARLVPRGVAAGGVPVTRVPAPGRSGA
ncbi:glycoside hydrolase family 35 protein [Streptomyces tagetis]|uniref:beta-galactosidase n=1 Tax=Streptomyces tagetis TaxID=2820809 RepID=A0A940XGY2_9ACTN|nr:beta galactosidase jelly roll domain-containing protein [Streptomyces sp. RG38]MBQ0830208.1 beta galactosidase jelly roll domain-containing protein [Streptomyces sp. RG38]